jgi:hypothetical protein
LNWLKLFQFAKKLLFSAPFLPFSLSLALLPVRPTGGGNSKKTSTEQKTYNFRLNPKSLNQFIKIM